MRVKHLVILSLILLMPTTASAQFGGVGFGGGGFGFSEGGFGDDGPAIFESSGIAIAISNSGKTVTAFSVQTGKIAKLSFDEKVEPFAPVAGETVACFSVGKAVHAFSAKTGKWDSIESADKLFFPVVSQNMIGLSNGNKLYAFGSQHGKWLSIETEGQLVPTLTSYTVKATDGEIIYICSETSTEWQVIDLTSDE